MAWFLGFRDQNDRQGPLRRCETERSGPSQTATGYSEFKTLFVECYADQY